jgi:CubicO group peptidase (beta-lactamase class C family)
MSFPKSTHVGLALTLMALGSTAALPQASMDTQRLARIPARAKQFVDQGQISGAVMLLAHQGEVVLHEAVGYQDIENQEGGRNVLDRR